MAMLVVVPLTHTRMKQNREEAIRLRKTLPVSDVHGANYELSCLKSGRCDQVAYILCARRSTVLVAQSVRWLLPFVFDFWLEIDSLM